MRRHSIVVRGFIKGPHCSPVRLGMGAGLTGAEPWDGISFKCPVFALSSGTSLTGGK